MDPSGKPFIILIILSFHKIQKDMAPICNGFSMESLPDLSETM